MSRPTPSSVSVPSSVPESSPEAPPCDCVRHFPKVSDDLLEIVGFDWEGHPRISIEMNKRDVGNAREWEDMVLRWVRRHYPPPIRLV